MIYSNSINFYNKLSWEKNINLVLKLQRRLFKTSYILDIKKLYELQKLILELNSSRLLAIKFINQINTNEKFPGIDGYSYLNFCESFELSEFLKYNWNNWKFQNLRKIYLLNNENNTITKKIPTISDRIWLTLIKFAIEPVHEALFHPLNLGFRTNNYVYETQRTILLNLSKHSFSYKKRLLKLDLSKNFKINNNNYLLKNIIAPKCIKLSVFKLLEKGFSLEFSKENKYIDLGFSSMLLNILLNGIEKIHNCIRHGYIILIFLTPKDNEKKILKKIFIFINKIGINCEKYNFELIKAINGFDFLEWHFKLTNNNYYGLYIFPNNKNYNELLLRIKHITNNSNYGSNIKASKIYPIIQNWKEYHLYSNLFNLKYSLFFIKKKAFKIFNSESKQDYYSSRNLLLKCFSIMNINKKKYNYFKPLTFKHLTFLFNKKNIKYYCIHCGISLL